MVCRTCGSDDLVSRGRNVQCKTCGDYTRKDKASVLRKLNSDGTTVQIAVMTERRIKTLTDLIEVCEIDTNVWEVERWMQSKNEGYRKDRSVKWKTVNGRTEYGEVNDSGKLIIKPLFSVKVWLRRKTIEIRNEIVVNDLVKKASKYAPKYKRLVYKKIRDGYLYEIGMPDLHLGRLVALEGAGHELNPKIQIEKAICAIDQLINFAGQFGVEKILLPVGNDFFDSNTAEMKTAHNTPQQDDVLWQRTYLLGCDFLVKTLDKLSAIAPTDVLVIPGNHDEERVFYLGSYLEAWYHKNQNVTIDNRPIKRKYYSYHSNLIGLTHGYYEKNNKLDALMAYEKPDLWAASTHREWHLGDKHHKADMLFQTEELNNGVVVRTLRSLASPSVWEFDKGFVGSQKSAEGFMWHPTRGLVAQFTA
jgi:hypothetical protein